MRSLTRIVSRVPAFLLVALFPALAPNALARSIWYVNGVNGSDSNNCQTSATACRTIGHAISLASSGDAISVAPATYTENLNINISLSIIGSGAATTIIDGGQSGPVVTIGQPVIQVTLSRITIQNGSVQTDGAGITNYGTLTINSSTITANSAYSSGGGIMSNNTLTVNDSIVSGNSLTYEYGSGGGILGYGTLTVNRSTITANSASDGGGIYIWGGSTATITNSTFSGNSATWGGGVEILGAATITNSTFSGNSAGDGGGIFNYGTLTINNATITGNSAQAGAGVSQDTDGSVVFQDSIIANNTGGNCSGTVTSNGYNLSSDGTCSFNGPGDMNNASPRLGSPGNYGGPTQTIIEMLGSLTVDAGNPNGCTDSQGNLLTTDQRGAPRPGLHKSDKRCDMGAFERQTD